jgi:RNA ligase (TIGR02306 family)
MPEATVEVILRIRKHPNADALELAEILGFQCVVPIGVYHAGQKIIYIHPDSVLPETADWAQPFLKYAKTRVKAIKIRNEWSEGIIMNLDILKKHPDFETSDHSNLNELPVGFDLSELLNITHYESPDMFGNSGFVVSLPHQIPKTDEERWETLKGKITNEWLNRKVDVTLKVDGQSWSAYYHLPTQEFGICGRRVTFKENEKNDYTEHLDRYNLKNSLIQYCHDMGVSLCIRGESYGKGIQKLSHNPHCKLDKGLALFSVYLIDEQRYAGREDRFYFSKVATDLGIPHVKILEQGVELTPELIKKYSSEYDKLDGQPFEGVVIKGDDFSFKVINKNYDSKK